MLPGRDIPRAFPANPEFNTAENHERLRSVLYAFCSWHPSVHYCQNMCFLAGFLLMHLEDEGVFYMLQQMHTSQLREYFTQSMLGWKIDEKCLEEWLAEQEPELVHHLTSQRLSRALANALPR